VSRRRFLLGSVAAVTAASAGVVAVPFVSGGVAGFLRRALEAHFGPDLAAAEGVDAFVREYADHAGAGDIAKRLSADLYFGWQLDEVHKIGAADALEKKFLETILVRSNIIALAQGGASAFEYTSADPWTPTCNLYLSALSAQA
jgi:hypothetical protein